MSDLGTTTVSTWVLSQVTGFAQVAAGILAATILVGLGIYILFWGINKLKGGLG